MDILDEKISVLGLPTRAENAIQRGWYKHSRMYGWLPKPHDYIPTVRDLTEISTLSELKEFNGLGEDGIDKLIMSLYSKGVKCYLTSGKWVVADVGFGGDDDVAVISTHPLLDEEIDRMLKQAKYSIDIPALGISSMGTYVSFVREFDTYEEAKEYWTRSNGGKQNV